MTTAGQNELRALQRSFIRGLLSPIVLVIAGVFFHFQARSVVSLLAVLVGTLVVGVRPLMMNQLRRSMRKHLAGLGDYSDFALVRGFGAQLSLGAMSFHLAATAFLVAHILETDWWAFSGGIVMALLWISQIPTKESAERWVEEVRIADGNSELVMNETDSEAIIQKQVTGLKIAISALLIGAAFFACVAAYVRHQVAFNFGPFPIISIVAMGLAATMLVVRPFVLALSVATARQKLVISGANLESDSVWLPIYGSRMITGAALIEGPVFMFFIAYLLEGQWWTIACGILLMALMAFWHFPTRERVAHWIAEQREQARMLG